MNHLPSPKALVNMHRCKRHARSISPRIWNNEARVRLEIYFLVGCLYCKVGFGISRIEKGSWCVKILMRGRNLDESSDFFLERSAAMAMHAPYGDPLIRGWSCIQGAIRASENANPEQRTIHFLDLYLGFMSEYTFQTFIQYAGNLWSVFLTKILPHYCTWDKSWYFLDMQIVPNKLSIHHLHTAITRTWCMWDSMSLFLLLISTRWLVGWSFFEWHMRHVKGSNACSQDCFEKFSWTCSPLALDTSSEGSQLAWNVVHYFLDTSVLYLTILMRNIFLPLAV
jgi:hypothetical protein